MNSTIALWSVLFLFSSWQVFRALAAGTIDNDDAEYDIAAQPIRFWLTVVLKSV
ncbi:MAG: hypothetical protein JO001_10415 [Alphaproteobacteria bacterium]|nr:hypothetical protein [Alphaproteobacteria bacterium]